MKDFNLTLTITPLQRSFIYIGIVIDVDFYLSHINHLVISVGIVSILFIINFTFANRNHQLNSHPTVDTKSLLLRRQRESWHVRKTWSGTAKEQPACSFNISSYHQTNHKILPKKMDWHNKWSLSKNCRNMFNFVVAP